MLSYFAEALTHTGLNIVRANGWNTVLAPVNAAFIAAGYPTLASIDNADISTLGNLLQYHILPGQFFSNTLAGLSTLPTRQGSNIGIAYTKGMLQFTGSGNSGAAMPVKTNGIGGKSVIIHEINTVLMP